MLQLDNRIEITPSSIRGPNLCDRLTDRDLDTIGLEALEGYNRDEQSRTRWKKRADASMKLALQVQEAKNFPWPECSNVKFPLITIAVLQFHARAYPALLNGPDVVRCRVIGEDPAGAKKQRSVRVSSHMSYQVLEEDQGWEEQHDKLVLNVAVVGDAFKKTYFDARRKHQVGDFVLAQDLVMDYYSRSVNDCMRKTHVIPLYRNEIYERVMRNTFRDVLEEDWYTGTPSAKRDESKTVVDNRQGLDPPQPDRSTQFKTLEQHTWLDLDGDGYEEPVIVTINDDGKVLRITQRFEREEDVERQITATSKKGGTIIRIEPTEYFTHYQFIPSPDGGIYSIGFGSLIGPLNESVDTGINQLFDAGTMSTAAGGFLGRGAKIRGGVYTFAPLEWKRVDSTGDDLRKNIFPLPVREPSDVLYRLLVLLINYTNRISGANDATVGENPGQNTPAQTEQTMIEMGLKIYSSIFKRLWRAEKDEFKKRYIMNALYMDRTERFNGTMVKQEDYTSNPNDIVPAADPNLVSDQQRLQQAMLVKQAAMTTPGYDRDEVERNFLRAAKVEGWEVMFKGAKATGPLPNPKMMVEELKQKGIELRERYENSQFMMKLKEEQRLNDAKIMELRAKALKLLEDADSEKHKDQIASFEAQIKAMESHQNSVRENIKTLQEIMSAEASFDAGVGRMGAKPGDQGGVPGAAQPSPAGGAGMGGGAVPG